MLRSPVGTVLQSVVADVWSPTDVRLKSRIRSVSGYKTEPFISSFAALPSIDGYSLANESL